MRKLLGIVALLSLFGPSITMADVVQRAPKTTPIVTTCDPFTCQLPKEIMITEQFLRARKNGLPYTPDPRPLTPFVEMLRLNQLSQTMAYINLFTMYGTDVYRQEALNRINYFLSLGDGARGNGPRDGMIAYMYFKAYDLFHDPRYLAAGQVIADYCVSLPDKDMSMNGGLMCALGLAAGYHSTGSLTYLNNSRRVTANTAPLQFSDGVFPHQSSLDAGKNMGYTAWMSVELLLLGQMDPQDPYTDYLVVRSENFLSKLFNSDGTYNVFDANGRYDYEAGVPGTSTTVGPFDTAGIYSMSLNMYATGRKDIAAKTLKLAMSQRMGGTDYGGYPDNTSGQISGNIWADGRPSILRTSLILWHMTLFQMLNQTCSAGPVIPCTTTTLNCSVPLNMIGVCSLPVTGTQTCLTNRYSQCLDAVKTSMTIGHACSETITCQDEGGGACNYDCIHFGSQLCYNGICASQCYNVDGGGEPPPSCTVKCYAGSSCTEMPSTLTSSQPIVVNACVEPA